MLTLNENQASKLWKYNFEYFHLAPTPHNERCIPAGENLAASKLECLTLAGQLERMYGKQQNAELFVMRNTHEFGVYFELCVMYKEMPENWEDENEEEWPPLAYAQKLESGIPDNWDADAIKFLETNEHPYYVTKVIQLIPAA